MSGRIKLLALLAVVVCAAIAVPQIATGARKKSHTVDATMKIAAIETSGSRTVLAGRVKGKGIRTPAVLIKAKVSGTTVTSRSVLYGKKGTTRTKETQTFAAQPDGSVKFTGISRFTGGTGRFRGARGKMTLEGTLPKGGSVYTYHLTGKLRY
jgi:hypothetical protein